MQPNVLPRMCIWSCLGDLVDSGMNGGMAGHDMCVLSTVLHAPIDITKVGVEVMECLSLAQCASVVETLDERWIILIMSQYPLKLMVK